LTYIFLNCIIYEGKRRRKEKNFPGADIIMKQIKEKPTRKRIGLMSTGAPARGKA